MKAEAGLSDAKLEQKKTRASIELAEASGRGKLEKAKRKLDSLNKKKEKDG